MLCIHETVPDDFNFVTTSDFPFPDVTDRRYCNKRTVKVNDQIAAIGILRLTSEGIVLVNPALPKVTRTKAIIGLIHQMSIESQAAGLDECHVFVTDPRLVAMLKRLGFVECVGTAMVKQHG